MNEETLLKTFSARLVKAAKEKGLNTPQELADATAAADARVSYGSVYRNWRGEHAPGFWNLYAYAKTLGIDLHYLITGETEHEPPSKAAVLRMVKELYPQIETPIDSRMTKLIKMWNGLSERQKDLILSLADELLLV